MAFKTARRTPKCKTKSRLGEPMTVVSLPNTCPRLAHQHHLERYLQPSSIVSPWRKSRCSFPRGSHDATCVIDFVSEICVHCPRSISCDFSFAVTARRRPLTKNVNIHKTRLGALALSDQTSRTRVVNKL